MNPPYQMQQEARQLAEAQFASILETKGLRQSKTRAYCFYHLDDSSDIDEWDQPSEDDELDERDLIDYGNGDGDPTSDYYGD